MGQNIIQLMNASDSVIDLEEKLKQSGHEFPNYKKYMKWLDSEWNQLSADRIRSVLKTSPTESRFPNLTVESEGIKYQLHGIVHGWLAYLAPGWHLRRNIRDYVSETVGSFHRSFEGEDYLYEQNMHILFDLIRSRELEDQTYTNKKSKSLLKDIEMTALSIPVGMFALVALPVVFSLAYVYSKTIRSPKGKVQGTVYLVQKALTDERYQAQFADFCIAQEIPQPFNTEKKYLLEKCSKVGVIVNSLLFMKPDAPTSSERSLWTAGELRDYAKRKRLNRLHYIGGLEHITEIAYFLQNPDFSFERLEDYRMSRR